MGMPANNNLTKEIHYQLVQFNWEDVKTPYMVATWLLLASIAKILFHVNKKFGETVPDSALLIVLGFAVGGFFRLFNVDHRIYMLQSHTFFYYLLPPIIFDAGFFMPNRQLFENFDSVLLFAFVGTIWNTLAIGFSLLWLAQFGLFSVQFTQFHILLFASLISAVDPVAVIAVFEEIHINEFLFINVFGEALFNDGVSVVLYKMFSEFLAIGMTNLDAFDYIQGIFSFLVIALGGVIIGMLFAIFGCIATKYTNNHVRILAPVFIFVIPYMSYMTAELLGLSSILAIIACGICMKQYVKGNLSHDAYSSVKYFVKMLAQSSETVIFLFLGLSLFSDDLLVWDWPFIGATIAFCLLYRVIGVVVQCAVLNRFRNKHFSCTDQFVLSYGGLRGAIAFGLVISIDKSAARQVFISTTLAVIFFTVFVQGITIRPLLFLLKVEKQHRREEEEMIGEKIFGRFWDYSMAGLEEIAGQRGKNSLRDSFERFNAKVLKPALMRGEQKKSFDTSPIIRAYTRITLQEALKLAQNSTKIAKRSAKISRVKSQSSLPTIMRTVSQGPDDQPAAGMVEDLDKLLSNRENVEFLYSLFSRLLDRKIEEVRSARRDSDGLEDDIKDDYMGILGGGGRRERGREEGGQQHQGAILFGGKPIIRRESTSPGQLCAHQNGAANLLGSRKHRRRLSHPSNCSSKLRANGGPPAIFRIGKEEEEESGDGTVPNGHGGNGNGWPEGASGGGSPV